MTHETRIALLVGLVFIVLFGLVLGQRSISFSKSYQSSKTAAPDAPEATEPGPEVVSAAFFSRDNKPVLTSSESQRKPAAPDAATPAPASVVRVRTSARTRTYRVRSGDTLIGIARKVYGRRFEDEHLRIYRANRDKLSDPAALSVGQVLVIPPLPGRPGGNRQVALKKPPQQKHYTEMTMNTLGKRFGGSRIYIVRSGDCLTGIARRTMGDASKSAVRKLLDANRDRLANPNRLTIGMRLKIPG